MKHEVPFSYNSPILMNVMLIGASFIPPHYAQLHPKNYLKHDS